MDNDNYVDEITHIKHLTQWLPHSKHSKNVYVPLCIYLYVCYVYTCTHMMKRVEIASVPTH